MKNLMSQLVGNRKSLTYACLTLIHINRVLCRIVETSDTLTIPRKVNKVHLHSNRMSDLDGVHWGFEYAGSIQKTNGLILSTSIIRFH